MRGGICSFMCVDGGLLMPECFFWLVSVRLQLMRRVVKCIE
jgi:hypothetical protein